MTVTHTSDGGAHTVSVKGRLDSATAPVLERELDALLADCDHLTVDFTGLEYMSSAGLRVLLGAHKRIAQRGGMTIRHVRPSVRQVFEITGFDKMLTII